MNPIKLAYLVAVAQLEAVTADYHQSDDEFDVDFEAAGEPEDFKAFYAAWSAANPERAANAQRLCTLRNEAIAVLTKAENALLDWCVERVRPVAKSQSDVDSMIAVRNCKHVVIRKKAIDLAMRLNG